MTSSLEKKNIPDLKTANQERAIELAKQFINLRMRPDCRPITKGAFCQQVFLSQKNLNIALKMIQNDGLLGSDMSPKSSEKDDLMTLKTDPIKRIREKRIMEGLGALTHEEREMLDEYELKKSNE